MAEQQLDATGCRSVHSEGRGGSFLQLVGRTLPGPELSGELLEELIVGPRDGLGGTIVRRLLR